MKIILFFFLLKIGKVEDEPANIMDRTPNSQTKILDYAGSPKYSDCVGIYQRALKFYKYCGYWPSILEKSNVRVGKLENVMKKQENKPDMLKKGYTLRRMLAIFEAKRKFNKDTLWTIESVPRPMDTFYCRDGTFLGIDETNESTECHGTLTRYELKKANEITSSLLCSKRGNKDKQHLSTKHSITRVIYL